MRTCFVIFLVTLVVLPSVAVADSGTPGFAYTAADTVRTNLWIAQALMADIAREIVAVVPRVDADVSLRATQDHEATPLLETQLYDQLVAAGHTAYLNESDQTDEEEAVAPVDADYEIRYSFEALDLTYPRVGRKLGLWKNWVDREMGMSVLVMVVDLRSGRLLMDERLQRSFGDRVKSDHMQRIDDSVYSFTTSDTAEGGLMSVLEELVVVGALTGLVTIYFANTGN
jgi:hypothetical protein